VANCAVIDSIPSEHLPQLVVDVSHRLVLTRQEQHVVPDECHGQQPCLMNDNLGHLRVKDELILNGTNVSVYCVNSNTV
jgi:hypothetical protein